MDNQLLPPHNDPAERGYLRFFYRDWRPTRFGRLWTRLFAWVSGLGLTPRLLLTLQVKDRTTGHLHDTILAVASYQGHRYLVSMLGNGSEWVQNVRVADGQAYIKRGRSYPVRLVEIPANERPPIIKAGARWRRVAASTFRSPIRRRLPISKPLQPITRCSASTNEIGEMTGLFYISSSEKLLHESTAC